MTTAIAIEAMSAAHPLQSGAAFGGDATFEWTRTALLGILGYGVLAGVGTLAVAFAYRALTVRELPAGPAVLVGVSLPAGWLTAAAIRRGAVIVDAPLVHYTSGVFLLGVLFAGAGIAVGGRRLGDHLACGAYEITKLEADGPVADLVQAASLAVAVTLPASIDDAEGYPSVDGTVKRELAGRTFLFPSDLSIPELRDRVRTRLESDYDVGYVRVELTAEGDVASLALGDRRAGVSPTLGPDRVAVAISSAPAPRASAGDPIEVWTTGDDPCRLVTRGTLRASTDRVTTLIVDADDADAFELDERYQLTTRPETPSDDHALVSAVRAADETVAAISVADGGPFESEFVGWVPGTVLAVARGDEVLSLPADKEPLQTGDTVYVFGTPSELETLSTGFVASPSNDETAVQASTAD